MKIGIVLITLGAASFIALVIFLTMALIIGDYFSAFWVVVYASIPGSISLYSGIKRIRKTRKRT